MHTRSAVNRWRAQVTQHRVAYALLAGFVATHIATITGYWYPVWHWPKMDYGVLNGMSVARLEGERAQHIDTPYPDGQRSAGGGPDAVVSPRRGAWSPTGLSVRKPCRFP